MSEDRMYVLKVDRVDRVEVFSISNNIRFRFQIFWVEVDDEIELKEEFQPSCLIIGENFGS